MRNGRRNWVNAVSVFSTWEDRAFVLLKMTSQAELSGVNCICVVRMEAYRMEVLDSRAGKNASNGPYRKLTQHLGGVDV